MQLGRFAAGSDAAQVRACHEIYLAALPVDVPWHPAMSLRCFQGWLVYGWTEDPSEAWLGRAADGTAAAWYRLSLPERENRRYAHLEAIVRPSRRRAGLGLELVRPAASRARAAGRT